jgi:hypothetical protein
MTSEKARERLRFCSSVVVQVTVTELLAGAAMSIAVDRSLLLLLLLLVASRSSLAAYGVNLLVCSLLVAR